MGEYEKKHSGLHNSEQVRLGGERLTENCFENEKIYSLSEAREKFYCFFWKSEHFPYHGKILGYEYAMLKNKFLNTSNESYTSLRLSL